MRPKKEILLIDPQEPRLAVRRFLLTTRGFRVFSASNTAEALAACRAFDPDLAVILWPIDHGEYLLKQMHIESPLTRTLAFAEGLRDRPNAIADMTLWGRPPALEFVERVKLLVARKRGPAKFPPLPVPELQDVLATPDYGCAGRLAPGARRIA